MHSGPGMEHDIQPIVEGLNTGSIDSSVWKFVPFWNTQEYKNTIVVYLTKKSIHLCQHQYSVKLSF